MRRIKLVRKIVLFAMAGVALLPALLWIDHTRQTTLPAPTGSFAVGRATYVWSDSAQSDKAAAELRSRREFFAWIWYPAAAQPSPQKFADYLPAAWRTAVEGQRGKLINQLLTRDLSRVVTHSVADAEVSPQQRLYPVILIRAGLAALVTNYTSLAEDLASHGYVVVGFDAPYRSAVVVFPDGRVIARSPENDADRLNGSEQEQLANGLVRAWVGDSEFALDQLNRLNTSDPSGRFLGRLDMQRIGAFGHSLGGATALQFCHDDDRCKAGIDVDGAPLGSVVKQGVKQPFLFLLSDHDREPDAETEPVKTNIRSIYERLPNDRRLGLTIRGANHYMFSDDGAMLKSPLLKPVLRASGILRIDGRRQVAVTAHYISTFFDVYLKGAPASELQIQPQYSEVEYLPWLSDAGGSPR